MRRLGAVVAAAVLVVSACASEPDPRGAVIELLGKSPDPDIVTFRHAAAGTRVADCITPNRRFDGTTDYTRGRLVLSDQRGPIAVVEGGRSYLHRSLFADGVGSEWLAVTTPAAAPLRQRLTQILGPDLAGYALAGDVPPTPRVTAQDVADAADAVTEVSLDEPTGDVKSRFRATVSASTLSAASSSATDDAASPSATVDLFVDGEGRVDRIVVTDRGAGRGAAAGDGPDGWAIDYPHPPADAEPVAIDISDALPVQAVSPDALAPAPLTGCEVPL